MFTHNVIKRAVIAGLAVGAASLPAAAQAMVIEGPAAPVKSSAVGAPPVQPQLARLHADLQQRSGAQDGGTSVAPSVSAATSGGAFQWGDAGIGAAGAVLLLGTGAGAAGAMRRRRVHRPVTR